MESAQGGSGEGGSQLPPITYFSLFSGQFLEELSKFSPPSYKLRTEKQGSSKRKRGAVEGWKPEERRGLAAWVEGKIP